jgi:hypothetical protein
MLVDHNTIVRPQTKKNLLLGFSSKLNQSEKTTQQKLRKKTKRQRASEESSKEDKFEVMDLAAPI